MSDVQEEVESGSTRRRGRTALVASVIVGVLLVGFVVVLAVGMGGGGDDEQSPLIGQPAPPVAGTTLDGQAFDIDDLRGRWVLVNFFAQWCSPCLVEHPELVAFDEAHADAGDVEIVSVAFQDDPDDIREFFAENGGDWIVLGEGVDPVAVAWGVSGLPETFLVSPQGFVVSKFTGGVTEAELESVLSRARGLS